MTAKTKTKKLTAEERLQKALAESNALEAELPLLVPARLWYFIEALARLHLQDHGNDQPSRNLVAQFGLACRELALEKMGHDTMESLALGRMLREGTARWTPKPPRLDSITYINSAPHKPQRFNTEQESAANSIRDVWLAFGKFLDITGRGIGGGGGGRQQAQGPVDVMGQVLWDHHRDVFKPWVEKAARTIVERRTTNGIQLTIAAVVFKVLVEDIYPEELDQNFALVGGTALRALKAGLNAYHAPGRLDGWGRPKPQPPAGPKEAGLQPGTAAGGSPPTAQGPNASPAPAPAAPAGGLWQAPRPPAGYKAKLAPRKKAKQAD